MTKEQDLDEDLSIASSSSGTVSVKLDYAQILLRTIMKIARSYSYRTTDPGSGIVFRDTVKTLDILLFPYQDKIFQTFLVQELKKVDEAFGKLDSVQQKAKLMEFDIERHTARFRCLVTLMKRKGFLPDLGRTTYL